MQYYVFENPKKQEQIETLESLHEAKSRSPGGDDFKKIIRELVTIGRETRQDLSSKGYIRQILISANLIVYSFEKFKTVKENPSLFDYDEEKAMGLVFIVNAKAFLELVKSYTKVQNDDDFNSLIHSITLIRNYFSHSYNKDFEKKKFFIDLSLERGVRDYSVLEVSDIETGSLEYEISFSFELFYFSLREIFRQLKENPGLFKINL